MGDIILTTNNIKQHHRDLSRRYFSTQLSFGLQHIKNEVFMLMNFENINAEFKNLLKKEFGEGWKREYELTRRALERYDALFSYANLINNNIISMKEASGDAEHIKIKIDHQNFNLMKIASELPATDFRICKAYFLLINACDLRNTSVPKLEMYDQKSKYPSYLQDGGQQQQSKEF